MNTLELREMILKKCIEFHLDAACVNEGRTDAEIVIIGEGPGQEEARKGMPFIGYAGKLLWNTLRQHGILRTQCYTTNVCKRQLSLATRSANPVSIDEWTKWQHILKLELAELSPKVILCFGNAGLQALFGETKITKHRGSVYKYELNGKQIPVVIAYNPSAILRQPKEEIVFQMDMARLKCVYVDDFKEHKVVTHFNPTFKQAITWINNFISEGKPISVDLEFTAYETACVGLASSSHEAYCINFRDAVSNRFTIEEETEIMFKLQELYDSGIKFIAQNGAFDSHWHWFKDHVRLPIYFDTLLAHHTLYPQLPHNLGFLVSQYTTHPYYKDDIDKWREDGNIDTFWEYNGKDAALTFAIYEKLMLELKSQKLYNFYFDHVMRLQPHTIRSTVEGFKVDMSVKEKVVAAVTNDVDKALNSFHEMVSIATGIKDYKPNPSSPKQMKELLYQHLNLKHRSGTTNANARTFMLEDARTDVVGKNVITALNFYAKEKKFLSTYAQSKVDPDNRFRCDWKQYGVQSAPGRLSSSKTLWGTGGNMQNQPRRAQEFFIADEGDNVLIYFDLSQAEAQIVAYRANIPQWKTDFERARTQGDYDCHRALCSQMFKMPYDETPENDFDEHGEMTLRYISKRCRHGLNYRMMIAALAENTGMSYSRAASAFHIYHTISPEIKQWWAEQERRIKKTKQMFNAYGRRLYITQRLDVHAITPIIAFYPQSTIGDKVCRTWYKCHEDDGWDMQHMRIKLNIHDALIGIAHKDYAHKALAIMQKHATEPVMVQDVYEKSTEELIIPCDLAMSVADEKGIHRWSTLQKIKL